MIFCSVLRYVMLHTFWHHFRLWLIPFRFLMFPVSESCAQTGKGPKASTLARAKACLFFSEVLITFACRGAPEVPESMPCPRYQG